MTIQVFDKPMCCSTGICGPQVDQILVRFAGDLDWLRRQGVQVERYNLSQQPREFAQLADVRCGICRRRAWMPADHPRDGRIVCQGMYPSRQLLASWGHVASPRCTPVSATRCCQPGSGCC